MAVAGLFAGIGGLELAFAEAGYDAVVLSEIDSSAQSVLRHRFPRATVVGDIAGIPDLPVGVEIVTAGFPCQNLSMAGHGAVLLPSLSACEKCRGSRQVGPRPCRKVLND
jgi:DNA (cytosine-5)-methyltransferase 1